MRRLLTVAVVAVVLSVASGAQANTAASMSFGVYVDHATGRIDQRYQAWANSSREPVVAGQVEVFDARLCGGWFGCSSYDPRQGSAIHADTRGTFLFEEGHLIDWMYLTKSERITLSRVWGVYGKPWNNSPLGNVRRGDEDGLTADFGAAYRVCAEGQHVQGLAAGNAPPIMLHNTCRLLSRWL